jgi:hypothetical protein
MPVAVDDEDDDADEGRERANGDETVVVRP